MSTRSVTIINSEWDNKPICAMYRQYDGYLPGHGQDLKDAFGDVFIVNGIGVNPENQKQANGMGCFAAQVVDYFKDGIGGIYMTRISDRQEYNYFLSCKDGRIWVTVKPEKGKKIIFEGWLSELPTDE